MWSTLGWRMLLFWSTCLQNCQITTQRGWMLITSTCRTISEVFFYPGHYWHGRQANHRMRFPPHNHVWHRAIQKARQHADNITKLQRGVDRCLLLLHVIQYQEYLLTLVIIDMVIRQIIEWDSLMTITSDAELFKKLDNM